ncbi:unnamed protein product, partial [Bubo scandiacus]
MEHHLTTGVQKADALQSGPGKRRKAGHRRQHLGEGAISLTDRELLDLPLGVKIPVLPGSRPVFSRAKLGEKLHLPSGHFDLGDPYCRLLRTEYNSLHDPHLKAYHKRRHNFRRLKEAGYITSDGQVVCTLKEFNEYRQYLLTLKLQAENVARREEERLRQHLAKFKDAPEPAAAMDTSRLAQRLLQPQKPSCPPPPKGRKRRQCTRVKGALNKGQTCSQPELGQESAELSQRLSSDGDSERKPDVAADSVFKAALEQKAAAEAQQLEEEVAETVAQEVFERVKAPRDPSLCVLRKAALGSRERLCGSATRAEPSETSPPDCQQEMGLVGKELQGQEFSRASEEQSLEASKRAKLPVVRRWNGLPRCSDGDSERKPDVAADSVFKAALEQKAAAEAQQLEEEVAETVAQEVFERVKAPRDPSLCVLRKAALGSRERLCGSATRAEPSETSPPDCQQEMGLVGKELQGQEFSRASEEQSLEASKRAKLP